MKKDISATMSKISKCQPLWKKQLNQLKLQKIKDAKASQVSQTNSK